MNFLEIERFFPKNLFSSFLFSVIMYTNTFAFEMPLSSIAKLLWKEFK
jgi:hypothetical protein